MSEKHSLLIGVYSSLFFFSTISFLPADAAEIASIEFQADWYERDVRNNTVRARGNTWVKKGDREIWAEEIEIDFATNLATANGKVHIRDGALDIWCRHGSYQLEGHGGILEKATLVSGQMVITGDLIRKLDRNTFEVEEGSYTNCNIVLEKGPSVGECSYAWKVYGKFFKVTLEDYAHIYDAIIYIDSLPLLYVPYFVAPVKTNRQSGLLMFDFSYSRTFGNGLTLPYFWVLGPWHDITLRPTYYTNVGYHLGTEYRYRYSSGTGGQANFFIMDRRFHSNRDNPGLANPNASRFLGIIGEWAANIHNVISLPNRAHARQSIKLVSDPYYTFDYSGDVGVSQWESSLRSFVSFTAPSNQLLFTAKVEHHQPLVISKDAGIDRGAVTQLPSLSFSQTAVPFLNQLFFYEFDSHFTNFFRPTVGYDSISSTLDTSATMHSDPNTTYHDGNYIRTGRRLQLEPRLIANIPLPSGLQLQPVIKGGTLLYHFDYPSSEFAHREYAEVEIPFSLYLSKTFKTSIPDFEQINHVFQPRVIYASSLYQRGSDHPFFFENNSFGLSNPRFDIIDQITPFEYMRFELINRFRRKSGNTVERFFLIQLSEQYNFRTFAADPRFSKRIGPIELLSEIGYGPFSGNIEAKYQIEQSQFGNNPPMHEYDWSSGFTYRSSEKNYLRIQNRFRIRADETTTEQLAYIDGAKTLPIFFDLNGSLEYSLKHGELRSYRLGILFGSKPRSCWELEINLGRDAVLQYFANISFRLDFGAPGAVL